MSDKHTDDFDGITEDDNPMPDWWLWTFLLSIIFGFIYFLHFHVATDNSLAKEYAEDKARTEALVAKNGPKLEDLEAKFLAAVTDEMLLTQARGIYNERCAACHGTNGEGLIGPNLTDRNWLHGNSVGEIAVVMNEGVLSKGMPAWGQVLSQDDLVAIVGFVKSLEGKNLPGKAPQGEVKN